MSCIAWARRKTGAPKFSAALIFLWLLSLYQDKESNNDLGQRPINNNKPTLAPSLEGILFLNIGHRLSFPASATLNMIYQSYLNNFTEFVIILHLERLVYDCRWKKPGSGP
jgi:hypothetical protein